MRRTKEQKGITLIALIITIVVLLILAAVAISSITNDGILSYAQNAAKDYNQAVKNEQDMLQEYVNYLNNNSGSTSYEAYTIGQEVTIGGETFYVIEDSDETQEKVLLLAKENIDTTNLVQSSSANTIAFSSTNYWSADLTSSPYDLVETGVPDANHYAAYAAYQYGAKLGGTGRLMYYSEADTLRSSYGNMIWGTDTTNGYLNYWLGSAYDTFFVWFVCGDSSVQGDVSFLFDNNFGDGDIYFGVRPVIEISKSKIS